MTHITLSIEDSTYRKMKQHSEIKWSEFVRNAVRRRVEELEMLEKEPRQESISTMLASEHVLRKDWDNEADERWNHV
ncbi:hypothetical protein HYV84_04270 [Candidatus Woesearchaeota archaeon]|nr:hypothetical protein [Candidatus Woesearchaeota archaeon]